MHPQEFYHAVKEKNLISSEIPSVHVFNSSRLGVVVDIAVAFDIKHVNFGNKFTTQVATIIFGTLSEGDYDKAVKNAKHESSSENIQRVLVAKSLIGGGFDAVMIKSDPKLLNHPTLSKIFNFSDVETYDDIGIGVATSENINKHIDNLNYPVKTDPIYLEKSMEKEKVLLSFDSKLMAMLIDDTHKLILTSLDSLASKKDPDNSSFDEITERWSHLPAMNDLAESAKSRLLEVILPLSEMVKKNTVLQHDMSFLEPTGREREFNGVKFDINKVANEIYHDLRGIRGVDGESLSNSLKSLELADKTFNIVYEHQSQFSAHKINKNTASIDDNVSEWRSLPVSEGKEQEDKLKLIENLLEFKSVSLKGYTLREIVIKNEYNKKFEDKVSNDSNIKTYACDAYIALSEMKAQTQALNKQKNESLNNDFLAQEMKS
jgi:hypothetical protein